MVIPEFVKIGGHSIKVRLVDFDDPDTCGTADYPQGTIQINRNLPRSLQESTLIHEMMHFANTTIDHALLDSLAEQVYQILADNGMLNLK